MMAMDVQEAATSAGARTLKNWESEASTQQDPNDCESILHTLFTGSAVHVAGQRNKDKESQRFQI